MKHALLLAIVALAISPTANCQQRRAANLSEQKMCYEQAQKYDAEHVIHIASHYSKPRNICFAWIATNLYSEGHLQAADIEIIDAFENTTVADCSFDLEKEKVILCWAWPARQGSPKRGFTDVDQWKAFVTANYFND